MTGTGTQFTPITGIEAEIARGCVERENEEYARRQTVLSNQNLGVKDQVLEYVELGEGDALLQVKFPWSDVPLWGGVHQNRRVPSWEKSRDLALLHVLAHKYNGSNTQAHVFAARVLSIPVED